MKRRETTPTIKLKLNGEGLCYFAAKSVSHMQVVWNPQLEHHLDNFENGDKKDDDSISSRNGDDDDGDIDITERKASDATKTTNSIKNGVKGWLATTCIIILAASLLSHDDFRLLVLSIAAAVAVQALSWCWKQYIQYMPRRRNQARTQSCRMQVSSMLGSIGAPPLQSTKCEDDNKTLLLPIDCNLVLDFARAHASLLKKVDECLHVLKTSVSMSLRSTTQSVERVELSSFNGRNNRHHVVILPTARRKLAKVMMDVYNSLRRILLLENGDSDNQYHEEDVPQVISLAWFQSLRRELANSLSLAVSNALMSDSTAIRYQSRVAISSVQESTEYLVGAFDTFRANSSRCDFDKDWNLLSGQLEKARIALWTCQCSANDDENETNKASVLEFLQHFESLLRSTSGVMERLLQKNADSSNVDDNRTQDSDIISFSEPCDNVKKDHEYTGVSHDGSLNQQHTGPSQDSVTDTSSNKTIVFAGSSSPAQQKGAISKDERETAMHNDDEHDGAASQGVVLQELQQRLERMDRPEEVDTNGNAVNMNDTESSILTRRRKREVPVQSSIMLVGATASNVDLLSELKISIGDNCNEADAMDSLVED